MKKTAKYYKDNPAARKKKNAYQKKFNRKKDQLENRKELGKIRYKAKKEGKNIENLDYDHSVKKFVSKSVNRGRKEKSRLKNSKRK